MSTTADGVVAITRTGRSGSVVYREAAGSLTFYWEFGGGDAVALIQVQDASAWKSRTSWMGRRRGEILRFVADEVARQKAPGSRAEIDDAAGTITLRQVNTSAVPSAKLPPAKSFSMSTYRRLREKLAIGVLIAAVILGGLVWFRDHVLAIDPGKGTPLGLAVRTDSHIATLIQTLEPYVPSLHRDASRDRYRLSVYLVPLDGSRPQHVSIVTGLAANSYNLAEIIGGDGTTLWFNAAGIGGVDLKTGELVSLADLGKKNPAIDANRLHDLYGQMANGRLQLFSRDRQYVLEIEPETRKAVPATFSPDIGRSPFEPTPASFLSTGVFTGPNAWLGVVARKYLNAAFLRMDEESEPLLLSNPDGALMAYTSDPGLNGTLVIARVDTQGEVIWKADTGIDRFKLAQILPGERSMAFVGTRPPVPDQVSEPVLVIVDNATGAMATHSLWQ